VINFKNIECAFMVLTPQIGPAQAFAQRADDGNRRFGQCHDFHTMLKYNYCIPLPKVYLQTIAETGTGNDRKKTAYSHHYLYGGNTFWVLMAL
jgi:hypothetical protein